MRITNAFCVGMDSRGEGVSIVNKHRLGAVAWVVLVTISTDTAAIAANAAAGASRYPGPLDFVRRYSWQVVTVISAVGLAVAVARRWSELGSSPSQNASTASALKRDVSVAAVVGGLVIAAIFAFSGRTAAPHPKTLSTAAAQSPIPSPKASASANARAAAAEAASKTAPPATHDSTAQQLSTATQSTQTAQRTSSPAKTSTAPQAAQITRQPPSGYVSGDEIGLQPTLYTTYCVAWQDNVDATEYWLGTDTTSTSQGCTSPMLPDGNWKYSTATGLLATDDSNNWCLSVGNQTAEGVGLVVAPCDNSKSSQRWTFVNEGSQYLVKSDEGLCLYGTEENSAISASAQICGSTNSNELFNANSY